MATAAERPIDTPRREPDTLYEVIGDRVVETPLMGAFGAFLASFLQDSMGPFARANRLGLVVSEMLFDLRPASRSSPPDAGREVLLDLRHDLGGRRIWVVYPDQREVYDYDSPTVVRILTPADALEGGPLLPGFHLALSALFADAGGEADGLPA